MSVYNKWVKQIVNNPNQTSLIKIRRDYLNDILKTPSKSLINNI